MVSYQMNLMNLATCNIDTKEHCTTVTRHSSVLRTPCEQSVDNITRWIVDHGGMKVSEKWQPPDGGYGWVVVFSSCCLLMLLVQPICTFGLYMHDWMSYYDVSSAEIAWTNSLHMACGAFSGVIVGAFTDRYGCKAVAIAGGIIMFFGTLLSVVVKDIYMLYLGYGACAGIGGTCLYNVGLVVTQRYFTSKRNRATALVTAGMSIGSFLWPLLTHFLIETYTWSGAMLIYSAIYLHAIPLGMLLRVTPLCKAKEQEFSSLSFMQVCKSFLDLSLLKIPAFDLYLLGSVCVALGHFIPYIYLPIHAVEHGYSKSMAALLVSLLGAGSLACRLFHGWLADHKSINKFMLYSMMCFLSGCGMIAYKFSDQYYQMLIASVAYVIGSAGYIVVNCAIIVLTVGVHHVAKGLGFCLITFGIGNITSQSVGGLLYTIFGTPEMIFVCSGTAQLLAGCWMILSFILYNKSRRSQLHRNCLRDVTVS